MDANGFTGTGSLAIVLWGVGYLAVMHILARRESRPRRLTEAELLVKLARMGPLTEHDMFHRAAGDWNVSRQQVEEDFKTYLLEERLPYYVNAYLRQKGKGGDNRYRSPFLLGGGSLPWLR